MEYTSDRNQERRPTVEFSVAVECQANIDPFADYLQRVIKYEFGSDITSNLSNNTSNNTVPDTRVTYTSEQPAQTYEQPAQIFDNPTQTFEQPAQIYEQPVNDAIEVIPAGENDAKAMAEMAVEKAFQPQEREHGN